MCLWCLPWCGCAVDDFYDGILIDCVLQHNTQLLLVLITIHHIIIFIIIITPLFYSLKTNHTLTNQSYIRAIQLDKTIRKAITSMQALLSSLQAEHPFGNCVWCDDVCVMMCVWWCVYDDVCMMMCVWCVYDVCMMCVWWCVMWWCVYDVYDVCMMMCVWCVYDVCMMCVWWCVYDDVCMMCVWCVYDVWLCWCDVYVQSLSLSLSPKKTNLTLTHYCFYYYYYYYHPFSHTHTHSITAVAKEVMCLANKAGSYLRILGLMEQEKVEGVRLRIATNTTTFTT